MEPVALEQMHALAVAFRDDKFVSALGKLSDKQKTLQTLASDLDAREKSLVQREKEATVVINSQTLFNEQRADAMAEIASDNKDCQSQKDALAAEKKTFDIMVAVEEKRLKDWRSDLGQLQNKMDKVINTGDQAAKKLTQAEEMKKEYQDKLEELSKLAQRKESA